jgi:acyl-CoA thioester hydrolase
MNPRFADRVNMAGPTQERHPFSYAAAARVAFGDTDAQGVVYYGRYAPYFDIARVEYMRHLGHSVHGDTGPGEFVMRHFDIDYHAPARFDDLLEVFCRVPKIGSSSMVFEYAVTKSEESGPNVENELLATSTQVMVYIDLEHRRPCPVPDTMRASISKFENW